MSGTAVISDSVMDTFLFRGWAASGDGRDSHLNLHSFLHSAVFLLQIASPASKLMSAPNVELVSRPDVIATIPYQGEKRSALAIFCCRCDDA